MGSSGVELSEDVEDLDEDVEVFLDGGGCGWDVELRMKSLVGSVSQMCSAFSAVADQFPWTPCGKGIASFERF